MYIDMGALFQLTRGKYIKVYKKYQCKEERRSLLQSKNSLYVGDQKSLRPNKDTRHIVLLSKYSTKHRQIDPLKQLRNQF